MKVRNDLDRQRSQHRRPRCSEIIRPQGLARVRGSSGDNGARNARGGVENSLDYTTRRRRHGKIVDTVGKQGGRRRTICGISAKVAKYADQRDYGADYGKPSARVATPRPEPASERQTGRWLRCGFAATIIVYKTYVTQPAIKRGLRNAARGSRTFRNVSRLREARLRGHSIGALSYQAEGCQR